jgi:hypothetical protein
MATDHNKTQRNQMIMVLPLSFSFQIIVRPLSLLDKYIFTPNRVLKDCIRDCQLIEVGYT